MKKIIFLLLFFPSLLPAEWDQLFSENEDPSLFHHVNVITGNLNFAVQDTVVRGAHEFPLTRTYSSTGAFEPQQYDLDLVLKKKNKGCLARAF